MRNKSLKYSDRPNIQAVGNNRNTKNIQWINKYLSSVDGEANTVDIWLWLNENTKYGIPMQGLTNILGKGPYIETRQEKTRAASGKLRTVKVWRVNIDKVEERSDNNE
tara:strand:- start:231 stop:554 length:324 start_codon:yes stop_codon:yes gene_type:complete